MLPCLNEKVRNQVYLLDDPGNRKGAPMLLTSHKYTCSRDCNDTLKFDMFQQVFKEAGAYFSKHPSCPHNEGHQAINVLDHSIILY